MTGASTTPPATTTNALLMTFSDYPRFSVNRYTTGQSGLADNGVRLNPRGPIIVDATDNVDAQSKGLVTGQLFWNTTANVISRLP